MPAGSLPRPSGGSKRPGRTSGRGGVAEDTRPALLGAQDRQCLEQAAQEPAIEGQACAPGDLDGRDQEGCADRDALPRVRLARPSLWSVIFGISALAGKVSSALRRAPCGRSRQKAVRLTDRDW